MGEIIYNKLVRDDIPKIVKGLGKTVKTRMLNDEEYGKALFEKLIEESMEARDNPNDWEELADVEEVIYAILEFKKIDAREFRLMRQRKHSDRGGFRERILLESISD